MASRIKEIKFKDVDWKTIPKSKISPCWESGKGLSALVWKNKVGTPNNDILYQIKIPAPLQAMISSHVDDCINRD